MLPSSQAMSLRAILNVILFLSSPWCPCLVGVFDHGNPADEDRHGVTLVEGSLLWAPVFFRSDLFIL